LPVLAAPVLAWRWSASYGVTLFVLFHALAFASFADRVWSKPQRLEKLLWLLLHPALGTGVLYIVYREWRVMWLAVAIGFLGGLLLQFLLVPLLLPRATALLLDNARKR
jgi:hypothetical protein